jgi:hypothetical protein
VLEMYRNVVDQAARNDITAAMAAHHELGRDYDDAVAESLVDRIGAEIDKRVDARLVAGSSSSRSPAEFSRSGRSQTIWTGAAIGVTTGAALTGLAAMIANHGNNSSAVSHAVIVIWVVLAVAGLATALVRRYEARADHHR